MTATFDVAAGIEPVVWTNTAGVSVNANNLTKTAAAGWGNAGAVSTRAIASGDGYVEFSVSSASVMLMAGLSHGDSGLSYEDIDYAVFLYVDGNAYVYEGGQWKAPLGAVRTERPLPGGGGGRAGAVPEERGQRCTRAR